MCDQPHPLVVKRIVSAAREGNVDAANACMMQLWRDGYSAIDIIGVIFRIVKYSEELSESLKLAFIRQIGFTHMRIADGLDTLLQLQGLVGRLCHESLSAC